MSWFDNRTKAGIGVPCGRASGGLEVLDFDAAGLYELFVEQVEDRMPGLIERLPLVRTGSGKFHLYYRVDAIEGGRKLAVRVVNGKHETLIETRAHGQQVVAPGSHADCHASGNLYEHIDGPPLVDAPKPSSDERQTLFDVAAAFTQSDIDDAEMPEHVAPDTSGLEGAGDSRWQVRPGDDFNTRGEWKNVLEPYGWTFVRRDGDRELWRRPGKDVGWSATVNHEGRSLLTFFSENAHPLEVWRDAAALKRRHYTKFSAFAALKHGGDYKKAAATLAGSASGKAKEQGDGTNNGRAIAPAAPKNKNQSSDEPKKTRLKVVTMTDVTEQEQAYLWDDRIPRGCMTMIGGRQGTTKNLLLYYIISRITTGSPWWDDDSQEQREPGSVVLLEAEEDPQTQIKPRLVAAGADCDRVHLIEGTAEAGAPHLRHIALQRDLDEIDQLIGRVGDVDLVAISPISSYMGTVKAVSNEEVRNLILHPLKALAERHGCALILLKHPNKEYKNHDPLERIAGSAAFTETMRAAIILGNDPNEPDEEKNPRRVGFWEKWSLGPRPIPLSWKIHTGDNGAPAIHFLHDPIDFTARDMLGGFAKAANQQTKPQRAWEWIEDYLETGPTTMAEMNKTATLEAQKDNALFSTDAYARAKREAKTAGRLIVVKRPDQPETEWWTWLEDGSPPDWYSEIGTSNVGKPTGSNVSNEGDNVSNANVDMAEKGKVGTRNVGNVSTSANVGF